MIEIHNLKNFLKKIIYNEVGGTEYLIKYRFSASTKQENIDHQKVL